MARDNLSDLVSFFAVARERSFTKAAARLGVSQSALSHTIRTLEENIGVRLLTRTTRSVAPTEAGERLLRNVGPRFDEIALELAGLSDLREKPSGTIRITTGEHAAETTLWSALCKMLLRYPDVKVELAIDYGFTDIVTERYDAGVRLSALESGSGLRVGSEQARRLDFPASFYTPIGSITGAEMRPYRLHEMIGKKPRTQMLWRG